VSQDERQQMRDRAAEIMEAAARLDQSRRE
jgi:hypothetical protein